MAGGKLPSGKKPQADSDSSSLHSFHQKWMEFYMKLTLLDFLSGHDISIFTADRP